MMTNEEIIWTYLYGKLNNPYGAAAMMGNLFAESSLNPILANNVKKKTGLTNEQYTAAVDAAMNDNFVNDGIAYGLAQWLFHTRKKGLLDMARANKQSIGNINLQLDYLWKELQSYKTVMNALLSAKTIKEASDIVLVKYEKPSNQSDAVKELRAKYGQKYYDKYYKKPEKQSVQVQIKKRSAREIIKKMDKLNN